MVYGTSCLADLTYLLCRRQLPVDAQNVFHCVQFSVVALSGAPRGNVGTREYQLWMAVLVLNRAWSPESLLYTKKKKLGSNQLREPRTAHAHSSRC